jgi:hypothetical protein
MSDMSQLASVSNGRRKPFGHILTLEVGMIRKTLGVTALGVALLGAPAIATSAEAETVTNVTAAAQAGGGWWWDDCDDWGWGWGGGWW